MSFVFVPPRTPSPRARDLGRRIAEEIGRARREDPRLSNADVRAALRIAAEQDGNVEAASGVAIAAGMVALLLGLGVFFAARDGGDGSALPIAAVVVAIALILVAVKVARLSGRL
jgi:hypothetical protein